MTMLEQCVNPKCRADIDASIAFCPNCGADNRPPEHRPTVERCTHPGLQLGLFCTCCGCPVSDDVGERTMLNKPKGRKMMLAGFLILLIPIYLGLALALPLPLSSWVRSVAAGAGNGTINFEMALIPIVALLAAAFWFLVWGYARYKGDKTIVDEIGTDQPYMDKYERRRKDLWN